MSLSSQVAALASRVALEFKTIRSTYVPNTRTVAGKALSSNVDIAAGDLTASGTKDSTTFLRGDNVWAVPDGGGGGGSAIILASEDPVPGGTSPGLIIRLAELP